MHLLLYLYVGPVHKQPFSKPQVQAFHSMHPEARVVELDAACHPMLFTAAEAAMQEVVEANGKISVLVDCELSLGTEAVGPIRVLIDKLVRHKPFVEVQLMGTHAVLAPMLRIFTQRKPS